MYFYFFHTGCKANTIPEPVVFQAGDGVEHPILSCLTAMDRC